MKPCLCILLASFVFVSAAPSQYQMEEESSELGIRLPRATCDLLSFEIKGIALNHSACAAHCLVLGKGFRGGRCKDGICRCRK